MTSNDDGIVYGSSPTQRNIAGRRLSERQISGQPINIESMFGSILNPRFGERHEDESWLQGVEATISETAGLSRSTSEHQSVSGPSREEIAANIAASEARTDAKFERVMGRLDAIEKSTSGLRATMIGTGIAIAAALISVMAYGGQMFGIGLDSQAIADKAAAGVESRTSTRLDSLDTQIRALTAAIGAYQAPTSSTTPSPPQ